MNREEILHELCFEHRFVLKFFRKYILKKKNELNTFWIYLLQKINFIYSNEIFLRGGEGGKEYEKSKYIFIIILDTFSMMLQSVIKNELNKLYAIVQQNWRENGTTKKAQLITMTMENIIRPLDSILLRTNYMKFY